MRIGVVQNALIPFAASARLIGIDTRNDKKLVLYFVRNFRQARDIIAYRVLVISGTRTYDEHLALIFARQYGFRLPVPVFLYCTQLLANRSELLDLLRR